MTPLESPAVSRRQMLASATCGFGALATGISVMAVLALFRALGPKKARLISQIVAAIVGAGFIIGIQAAAIFYYGSISRMALFQSPEVIAAAPEVNSLVWLPAKAAMGDPVALPVLAAAAFAFLGLVISLR